MFDCQEFLQEVVLLRRLRVVSKQVVGHNDCVGPIDLPQKILQFLHIDPKCLGLITQVSRYDSCLHERVSCEAENCRHESLIHLTVIERPQRGKLSISEHHFFSAKHSPVIVVAEDL